MDDFFVDFFPLEYLHDALETEELVSFFFYRDGFCKHKILSLNLEKSGENRLAQSVAFHNFQYLVLVFEFHHC